MACRGIFGPKVDEACRTCVERMSTKLGTVKGNFAYLDEAILDCAKDKYVRKVGSGEEKNREIRF